MSAPNTLEQYKIIEENGLNQALRSIFQTVENNYLRRTSYQSDMQALVARIDEMENYINYGIRLEDDNLVVTLQGSEAAPNTSIDSSGNLILDPTTSNVDKFLQTLTFSVENGELYVSYGT